MKTTIHIASIFAIACISAICCLVMLPEDIQSAATSGDVAQASYQTGQMDDGPVIQDSNIRLCQGFGHAPAQCGCQGVCNGSCNLSSAPNGYAPNGFAANGPAPRGMLGVDDSTPHRPGREPRFRQAGIVPFEQFGYGEWVGPYRAPSVDEYRLRVGDQVEFVYIRTREKSLNPYQLFVGDSIDISSAIDESLNQTELLIRSDGKTTFNLIGQVLCAGKTVDGLQRELNDRYGEFVREPNIVVQVRASDAPLNDIIDSVDARQGQGGQSRNALVSPDGTIQLPGIGSVPAIGLTLNEIGREVNARYRRRMGGIEVTPVLLQSAPSFVFVLGEVGQPGRFELNGPTTVLQALALAQGDNPGGNLRQIIVLRRDQNWRLTATKLDLAGAIYGKRPLPSDDIWLRSSDIVLVPRKPIQRLSEAVNLYLTNTLYSIFPQQGIAFNFDNFTTF
jgi:polysaccharide export outer membrane protein